MNGTRAQGGAARLVVLALLVSILSQNVMGFLAGGQGLRLPGACRCAGFGFHGALLAHSARQRLAGSRGRARIVCMISS